MKAYVAAAALAAFFVSPVQAQQQCGDAEQARANLAEKYGEQRVGAGLSAKGYILEFWANAETGTWTVIAINTRGVACVLDVGQAFTAEPVAMGDPA